MTLSSRQFMSACTITRANSVRRFTELHAVLRFPRRAESDTYMDFTLTPETIVTIITSERKLLEAGASVPNLSRVPRPLLFRRQGG